MYALKATRRFAASNRTAGVAKCFGAIANAGRAQYLASISNVNGVRLFSSTQQLRQSGNDQLGDDTIVLSDPTKVIDIGTQDDHHAATIQQPLHAPITPEHDAQFPSLQKLRESIHDSIHDPIPIEAIEPPESIGMGTRYLDFIGSGLEWVQYATGLPWWVTIASAAVAVKLVTLPMQLSLMKNNIMMIRVKPDIERATHRMREAQAAGTNTHQAFAQFRKEQKAIYDKAGVSPMKAIKILLFQAPIFITFFLTIRRLAATNADFLTGGTLWFTNLTLPDPILSWTCASLIGASAYLNSIFQEKDHKALNPKFEPNRTAKYLKWLPICFAAVIPWLTSSFPSAIFVYWTALNATTLIQTVAFRNTAIRRALGLPILGDERIRELASSTHLSSITGKPAMFTTRFAATQSLSDARVQQEQAMTSPHYQQFQEQQAESQQPQPQPQPPLDNKFLRNLHNKYGNKH